jgi:hypothetical protein
MIEDKKARLIKVLEDEATRLGKHKTTPMKNHEYAIEYLKTGIRPVPDKYEFELLDAIQYDFETVCHDYGIV